MRGERLAELRKDAGYSQKEFAQIMHVSLNTVSLWERNLATPDDETKIRLAQMFHTSLDYLLGTTPDAAPKPAGKSAVLLLQDLPPEAMKELQLFLIELKKKYKL